jgi:ATP-binding cassette subfamily F protein 3
MDYEGTVILVSHDRDFLDGMCHRLFEFREGHVKEHLCDIKEFMEKRKLERLAELKTNIVAIEQAKSEVKNQKPKEPDANAEQEKQLKQLKNQLSKVEREIEQLESDIKKLDAELSDPEKYKALTADKNFFPNYEGMKKKLELALKEWEGISAKIG